MKNNCNSSPVRENILPVIPARPRAIHPSARCVLGRIIVVAATLLLAACGFHLRGQAALPFESMYISGSPAFATQLARAVRAGSKTRVVNNPKEAEVTLQILTEARERAILSLSGSGRVRELQIRYRVAFRVSDKSGKELLAPNEILLKRDLLYNDTDVLGKEQEEALLYRDMQSDAVQQVVRRMEVAHLNADTNADEKDVR